MEEQGQSTLSLQEWFAQGVQHLKAERWPEAESIFRQMLAHWPNNPDIHHNLGAALKCQRKLEAAIASFQAALAIRPDYAAVHANLGDVLVELNRLPEAMEAYQKALALRPEFPEAWNNMGIMLRKANQPAQAIEAYRRALALQGTFSLCWSNLAGALKDTGQLDEALACYERGMALQPGHAIIFDNRLCTLNYHPAYDAMAIFREARLWNDRFARPLCGQIPVHDNDPSSQRRLRIGYVSSDFRRHCESLFTTPLLSHHDHEAVEVFCYSGVAVPDAMTARLRRYADVWRDISILSDEGTARLIRQDRIDILVDLTLHLIGSRLGVFARKAAPIQVTWLGYPGTTGLDAIDYRLTDPRLDPVDSGEFSTQEPYYSERSVHLPDSFWCYDPRGLDDEDAGDMPEVSLPPVLTAGHITFGCLNNFCKVTDRTLELWAPVFQALPNAQLLLVVAPGPHRQRIAQKLGAAQERVQFVVGQPWRQYLATYRRIDICLDTLPFNGGTTSLDAMWMGVPVITRVGQTVVGRAGLSHLHNLGLMELVARTDREFVQKAVELAGDLDRLGRLRATLRQRMRQSPLMDGPRFARNMEAAYRRMWQAWCRK